VLPSRSRRGFWCQARRGAALVLAFAMLALLPPPGAHAAATPWVGNRRASARLITAEQATGSTSTLDAGLEIRLASGWHTYWRTPGAAGIPASISWTGSRNLRSATLLWPVPRRFVLQGLQTYGYEKQVVLPIALGLADPAAPLRLHATVAYMACKNICVPLHAAFTLALPAGLAVPGPQASLIAAARARVPGRLSRLGVALRAAEVAPVADGRATLILRLALHGRSLTHPDLFVEGLPRGAPGPPRLVLAPGGRRASLVVANVPDAASVLAGRTLAFTLTSRPAGRSAEAATFRARPHQVAAAAVPGGPALSFAIVSAALLGGLILNVMPCVLPVLSLKFMSLSVLAGAERRRVRLDLLATAAGVLAGFGLLAGALIGLKEAGAAVGWGIQFQEPWFLAAMTMAMALFAANLWGWLEIELPGGLASSLGTLQGSSRAASAFLTGLFAALLAASCTAPFVGTAVGFALAGGPADIAGIFLAMGLGLAAPYLLGAALPRLVGFLPRPGRWMLAVRAVLGFLLLVTGFWLLAVLVRVGGRPEAALIGALAAALLLVLAWRHLSGRSRRVLGSAAAVLVVAAVLVPLVARPLLGRSPPAAGKLADGIWRPFDAAAIGPAVAHGRVVFVDVTADWCLICKANALAVLDRNPVAAELGGPGVVAMRADWTRASPAITTYLQDFGRYGVPLDVVYGPGVPDGRKLPDLLTPAEVTNALAVAALRPAQADPLPLLSRRLVRLRPPVAAPALHFIGAKGRKFTLADERGKGVVLNVWATWCVPCRAEMPALDRLAPLVATDGIIVLPVSIDMGGQDQVRKFYSAHRITHLPIVLDPSGDIDSALKIAGVPTTLLVDPEGRMVGRVEGPVQWDAPASVAALRRLIGSPK